MIAAGGLPGSRNWKPGCGGHSLSASESPGKGCRTLYPGPPTLLEQERSARLVYLCQLTSADGLLGKPQPGASLSDFRGCLKMGSPSSSWKNCSQRGSGLPNSTFTPRATTPLMMGTSQRGGQFGGCVCELGSSWDPSRPLSGGEQPLNTQLLRLIAMTP